MYRNCIFCSARLGFNDALERFPVGRTLAFDGEKGRLWTVCRRCARWNLAPLEERWEAIEDAERLFRDTRLRVQSENIGIAKLGDGTRLIRVGEALEGEVAAWRYGQAMARRRLQHLSLAAGSVAVTGATFGILLAVTGFHFWALGAFTGSGQALQHWLAERRIMGQVDDGPAAGEVLRWKRVRTGMVEPTVRGDGLVLRIPRTPRPHFLGATAAPPRLPEVVVKGDAALRMITRAMPMANASGARRSTLDDALELLADTPPREYVSNAAEEGFSLAYEQPPERLAFEMALNEESERRAMDGELAALEAMWREAEQIADIADRLPDALNERT
ncbi:hypothetical protein [Longimicrobium terrae]|uniref:Uncharacterized protein n=1 Tax=Longimicrobium terrae TaxID=1639882 RepID=A0A841GZN9_9BACT|nr:hypothetical protein [Longimicrobium terrae]MBB4636822.1 hypothetical protein [Longimicrobium terrae]MBB6071178.1 hypothetical protein [Longimicrobium terrae]NNC29227.1 hypothetical protein [Longimicrobium terrae]